MVYTKTPWVDENLPAINATNLNKIEDGIYVADSVADRAESIAIVGGNSEATSEVISEAKSIGTRAESLGRLGDSTEAASEATSKARSVADKAESMTRYNESWHVLDTSNADVVMELFSEADSETDLALSLARAADPSEASDTASRANSIAEIAQYRASEASSMSDRAASLARVAVETTDISEAASVGQAARSVAIIAESFARSADSLADRNESILILETSMADVAISYAVLVDSEVMDVSEAASEGYSLANRAESIAQGAGGGAATLLELTDTPAGYDNGKILKSTPSGTEWATITVDSVEGSAIWEDGPWRVGEGTDRLILGYGNDFDYYINLEDYSVHTKNVGSTESPDLTGSGTATASDYFTAFGGNPPYMGVDDDEGTWFSSANTPMPHWWQYDFGSGNEVVVQNLKFIGRSDILVKDFTFLASNTGAFSGEETLLGTYESPDIYAWNEFAIPNNTAYRYYRIVGTSNWGGGANYFMFRELEMTNYSFFDWQEVQAPAASEAQSVADRAESIAVIGESIGTRAESIAQGAGGAATLLELTDTPGSYDEDKYLQSTDAGIIWSAIDITGIAGAAIWEDGPWRVGEGTTRLIEGYGDDYDYYIDVEDYSIHKKDFPGTESGDVITGGTPNVSGFWAWGQEAQHAVDNNTGTYWTSDNSAYPHWWDYDFGLGNDVQVQNLYIYAVLSSGQLRLKNFSFRASHTGAFSGEETVLYSGQMVNSETDQKFSFINNTAYRYYRIVGTNNWIGDNWMAIREFKFTNYITLAWQEVQEPIASEAQSVADRAESLARTADPSEARSVATLAEGEASEAKSIALWAEGGTASGWLSGNVAPTIGLGEQNNFYLNEINHDVYKKDAITTSADLCNGGTASANSQYFGNGPSRAVDNVESGGASYWQAEDSNTDAWWMYDFGVGNEQTIGWLRLLAYYLSATAIDAFTLSGSNNTTNGVDGDWDLLLSDNHNVQGWVEFDVTSNTTAYRYYKIDMAAVPAERAIIGEVEMMDVTAIDWDLKGGNTVSEAYSLADRAESISIYDPSVARSIATLALSLARV